MDRARVSWQRHGAPIDDRLTLDIATVDDRIADEPNVLDQWETEQVLDRRLRNLEVEMGIAPDDPLKLRPSPDLQGPGRGIGLGL